MTEYKIDHYAIRTWSSRSLPQQASAGMAVTAIYVFDEAGEHRGTISFFPDTLPELTDPALIRAQPLARDQKGRIELRFYQVQFFPTLEQLRNGETTHIYYRNSGNAGLR
jgi:hypothetical protein